jgi:hypothetical protein
MRHRSFEDMRVYLRDLESILLPPIVECVDGVLQVMVPRAVPSRQCLPSNVGHCLSTRRLRSEISVPADHLLSIKDLHCVDELHAPCSWNAVDLALWGLGDAQLKQQTMKLCKSSP